MPKHALPKHRAPRERFTMRSALATGALIGIGLSILGACSQDPTEGIPHAAPQPVVQAATPATTLSSLGTYDDMGVNEDPITAARFIAARMQAHRLGVPGAEIYEDWTWQGMPAVVGAWNDSLLDEWQADDSPDPLEWLQVRGNGMTWAQYMGQA